MTQQHGSVLSRKVIISFDIAWDKLVEAKQTLFPVWGEGEDRKPKKGKPMMAYTLRATKGVNMHPCPILTIKNDDGTAYRDEEVVAVTVVSAEDKLPSPPGSCSCGGVPMVRESKPGHQLLFNKYSKAEMLANVRGGTITFQKLQIACCSGARGHGSPFCLKIEFVKDGSPLKGQVVYSVPIDVGAKGPFAKINQQIQARSENKRQLQQSTSSLTTNDIENSSNNTYEGQEQMVQLLTTLGLQAYIDLFVQQEIDIRAFMQLNDSALEQMGITKVGPKVKILNEIELLRLRENTTLPMTPLLPPSTPSCGLIENGPFDGFLPLAEDIEQRASKRPRFEAPSPRIDVVPPSPMPPTDSSTLSLYIYLSNVIVGKHTLKKTLFMVKSQKPREDTDTIVQKIQKRLLDRLVEQQKRVLNEGAAAQLMLVLSPDKSGEWIAMAPNSEQIWNFRKGDCIKIANFHSVDISISVYHFFLPELEEVSAHFVTNFTAPKKFPLLFPGGCLEIDVDENKHARVDVASKNPEYSKTFAFTHNGKLIGDTENVNETCVFSFKRKTNNPQCPKLDSPLPQRKPSVTAYKEDTFFTYLDPSYFRDLRDLENQMTYYQE